MDKLPDEQRHFYHGTDMTLEYFARSLFGDVYYGSTNWTSIGAWKKFYVAFFDVLDRSVFQTIGSIDKSHKTAIQELISASKSKLKAARRKDEVHRELIVALMKLIFLLLGRPTYVARTKSRSFSTFRTLTYCQTEEQLSWLLQEELQRNPKAHGFEDSFEADFAFLKWAKSGKRKLVDRSNYVDWVRGAFPETYNKFR